MFQKLNTFWTNFWHAMKYTYNVTFKNKPSEPTQDYTDTKRINFLSVFVSKLNNLANTDATFDVESDSTQTDQLKELCKDLESKRFDVTAEMLGKGDLWVFPATNASGKLYHRYVPASNVSIVAMDGEQLTDIIGIIDKYIDNKNNVYFLNRRHTLDNNTLTIETYTTNDRAERVTFAEWAELESAYQLTGVDFIGVGRFKSPTSSRGHSPIYGVPLNYGCEEIENKCFNDLKMIETEFERCESKIFANSQTLKKVQTEKGEEFKLFDGVYSVGRTLGESGKMVDIFAPPIRYTEMRALLLDDMHRFEQIVGVDKGFLTPFENASAPTAAGTATEIRRANASTIALIDKIHTALKNGVEQTLKADGIFLNVSPDLYTLKIDWFDSFEDYDKQYERLANAVDRGVAEKADELQWLFPNLTAEEREEKLARIEENKNINEDEALEKMLMGEV